MSQQNTPEQKKPEIKVGEEIKKSKGFWGKFMTFLDDGWVHCGSYCRCWVDDCHFVDI